MVAARYAGTKPVIGTGFTELYFLVVGIMFGAIAIAFTTAFVVELIQDPLSGWPLAQAILVIPWRVLTAGLNGVGWVTVIFIIMTRVTKDQTDVLEKGWSINDLDGVKLGTEVESRLESVFGFVFLGARVVILVVFPGIETAAELVFSASGLPLDHEIVVPVFRWYALVLAALILGQMVAHFAALKVGARGRLVDTILSGATILVFAIMLLDARLYANDVGLVGFKMIFGVVLVINGIERVSEDHSQRDCPAGLGNLHNHDPAGPDSGP